MTSTNAPKVIGVDVGGTFTDLIMMDEAGGDIRLAKVPTTLDNQAFGVLAAIEKAGEALGNVKTIVHGTTATTNAMLERKISTVGLITTRGFRDVLELGRRTRPQAYGLKGQFVPLIPRHLRLEVSERVDASGAIVTPLDEAEVRQAALDLQAAGCEAVVIHFLHAYTNAAHEQRAAAIVREVWPNEYVTMGHAILSEYREYERGVTAAVNASIQPVLDRYITRLQDELTGRGYSHDLLVMQGNGGTVSSRIVAEAAVNTVMSGPASGVIAAAMTAKAADIADVITFDMGGTSCDVGLILDNIPAVSSELELEYAMPIHVPMVDVHTIGAGGGSVAYVNDAGLLQVGPESAGATPGPICYGRGGQRPTIADANLVLGRLNPDALLGVDTQVSLQDVKAALQRDIGDPLGLDAEAAAGAILRIANDKMAGALRMVSLSRGHDPRDFALFAFGGAGPLHAVELARALAIPKVLIPARPGITNALGCLAADLRHDFVKTVNVPLATLDMSIVRDVLEQQITDGRAMIARESVETHGETILHVADMQFQGQSHLLAIPIATPDVSREALQQQFADAYWQRFEVDLPEIKPVLVNLHTAVIGKRRAVPLSALGSAADSTVATVAATAPPKTRAVWFEEGWFDTPVLRRAQVPPGTSLTGPAIVEQMDTTIVIQPGDRVTADDIGNLIVDVSAESHREKGAA